MGIHIALYPITVLLAIAGYFCIALSASASVGIESRRHDKSSLRTVMAYLRQALLTLCTVIVVMPIAACCVALCAVPDILLLLARPVLPLRIKLALLPWFFPTSVAFWS